MTPPRHLDFYNFTIPDEKTRKKWAECQHMYTNTDEKTQGTTPLITRNGPRYILQHCGSCGKYRWSWPEGYELPDRYKETTNDKTT